MGFELKILGSNSAKPSYNRNQTSQLLTIQNEMFLIDCGEGTQLQLNQFRVKESRIKHIFISHLHGDHFFGLIGLLSTMHLHRRSTAISIYAPPELAEVITLQLKITGTVLSFKVNFVPLIYDNGSSCVYESDAVTVETIPLVHRVPCFGFLFREKQKPRRIIKEKILPEFSMQDMILLKNGKDLLDKNGNISYKNGDYTRTPRKSRSYAYCSDTLYHEPIIEQIMGVDLLYHEATFLEDRLERAKETFHSTAKQAATMAKKAAVGALIIGHFSSRYKDIQPLLGEAKEIFESTKLAIEGESTYIED